MEGGKEGGRGGEGEGRGRGGRREERRSREVGRKNMDTIIMSAGRGCIQTPSCTSTNYDTCLFLRGNSFSVSGRW